MSNEFRKIRVAELFAWLQRERAVDESILRTAERLLATSVVDDMEGNVRDAARLLGCSPKKVYDLIKESGLELEPAKSRTMQFVDGPRKLRPRPRAAGGAR